YLMVSMSCLRMRTYEPRLPRPFKVPGGRVGIGLACVSSLACIAILVLPSSPASIGFVGWAIVGAWVLLGVALHVAQGVGERAGEAVGR
ncbi:MAG: APC family permease, partial [Olsenella sp.]